MEAAFGAVGFVASIATLAGVALQSVRLLHEIRKDFKDTPKEVDEFVKHLIILHGALQSLETADDKAQTVASTTLRETWNQTKEHMHSDLERFREKVASIHKAVLQRRRVKSTLHNFIEKPVLLEYQQRFTRSIGILTLLVAEINASDSEKLSTFLVEESKTNRAEHHATRGLLSRVEIMSTEVKGNVERFSEDLEGMSVRLTKTSTLLRNTLIKPHPSLRTKTAKFDKLYMSPLGILEIKLNDKPVQGRQSHSAFLGSRRELCFNFTAPEWVTSFGFSARLTIDPGIDSFPSLGFSLRPFTVNQMPGVWKTLANAVTEEMESLLEDGMVHQADYILHGDEPRSLLELSTWCWRHSPWPRELHGHFFSYLIHAGAPLTLNWFSEYMAGLEFFSSQEDESWKEVVTAATTMSDIFRPFKNPHDLTSTGEGWRDTTPLIYADSEIPSVLMSLAYTQKSLSGVEWLLLNEETVLLETFSRLDKWLLVAMTSGKSTLADRVERVLQKYNSSRSNSPTSLIATHFGTILDVIQGVTTTTFMERSKFLGLLCRSGNREILRPFLEAGIDVNEHLTNRSMRWRLDYIAEAVGAANKDTFGLLLEYGAVPENFPPENITIVRGHDRVVVHAEDYPYFFDKSLERFCEKYTFVLRFLASERAMSTRPDLFEQILKKAPLDRLVGRGLAPCSNSWCRFWDVPFDIPVYDASALWRAIVGGYPQAIQAMIDAGAQVNSHIGCVYTGVVQRQDVSRYTWLSLAVRLGRADCVALLLRNGANPHLAERGGPPVLELARAFARGSHPRHLSMIRWVTQLVITDEVKISVGAEDDAKILALVEEAYSNSSEVQEQVRDGDESLVSPQVPAVDSTSRAGSEFQVQQTEEEDLANNSPQSRGRKFLTASPFNRFVTGIRRWVSLSHSERLLIGIGLILSYTFLILYTIFLASIELAKLRRLPKSAWIAILVAMVVWMWRAEGRQGS